MKRSMPRWRALALLGGLAFAAALLTLHAGTVAGAEPPALMLANVYRDDVPLAHYWVSEKFDGVRGYWDGQRLRTRGGATVAAPAWFTAGWPAVPLDGELWAGRGRFNEAASTVARDLPEDAAWRRMRFMVFDLPGHPGAFTQRIDALKLVVDAIGVDWVRPVEQFKVADRAALQALLARTVKAGGEGLMLHRGDSLYRGERTHDLLKLKPYEDAEARVVAHIPGRGKHRGVLGALVVETPEGVRFRLGTGFSNAERRAPPPPGRWVTYRHMGLTASGIPRFASFLRERTDWTDEAPAAAASAASR